MVYLNVSLHGFSRGYEVVVPAVDLELPPGPGGVRDAGAELLGVLRDELVVYSVLEGPENDHRPGVVDLNLLDELVGHDGVAAHLVAVDRLVQVILQRKEAITFMQLSF